MTHKWLQNNIKATKYGQKYIGKYGRNFYDKVNTQTINSICKNLEVEHDCINVQSKRKIPKG